MDKNVSAKNVQKNGILVRVFQIYVPHFCHEQRVQLNKKKSQGISDQPKWQEKVLLSHDVSVVTKRSDFNHL